VTRHMLTAAVIALGLAACGFDLVDVDPVGDVAALLSLRVTAEDSSEDLFSIEGSLKPGSTLSGGERRVHDPSLRVLDSVLLPETVFSDQGTELRWMDTVLISSPRPEVVTLRFPLLAQTSSPGPLHIVLRTRTPPGVPQPLWTQGTDLQFSLTPSTLTSEVPESVGWTLGVQAWAADGSMIPIMNLRAQTEVPDTILVPGNWFPSVPLERLEAFLEYERGFVATSIDDSYRASVWFTQRFQWEFVVIGP